MLQKNHLPNLAEFSKSLKIYQNKAKFFKFDKTQQILSKFGKLLFYSITIGEVKLMIAIKLRKIKTFVCL